jgi:hypothetical protein
MANALFTAALLIIGPILLVSEESETTKTWLFIGGAFWFLFNWHEVEFIAEIIKHLVTT